MTANKPVILTTVFDTHNGSRFALPHGEGPWTLPGGNEIFPNPLQLIIWRHWLECWQTVGALRKRNRARLVVVKGGDDIEGIHHGIRQLMTDMPGEQSRMHLAAMRRGLAEAGYDPKRDRIVELGGTEAHAGPENENEEEIARDLTEGELDGERLSMHLLASVNGVLFDFAHDGMNDSSRPWLYGNGIRAGLRALRDECIEYKQPVPRYVVRGHKHTFRVGDIRDSSGRICMEGFISPSWKVKDRYVYSRFPAALSSIGLLVWEIAPDGEHRWHPLTMTVLQDEAQEL